VGKPKLVVGLQVYNEADKFLKEWVQEVAQFADALVVLDDCSSDRTVPILFEGFKGKPMLVSRAPENTFTKNEVKIRKWLWEDLKHMCAMLLREGSIPWILMLDADEFLEEKLKRDLPKLIRDPKLWFYYLTFYHFWRSRTHYRVDKLWKPPQGPRLIRYDPAHTDKWKEAALHCGSTPINLWNRSGKPGKRTDYVIKHFGYVLSPEEKYERYMKLDPNGKLVGALSHYKSMLDKNPVLVEWKERV
jgi:glycosyltransferase involved in cell wall biosynthesis